MRKSLAHTIPATAHDKRATNLHPRASLPVFPDKRSQAAKYAAGARSLGVETPGVKCQCIDNMRLHSTTASKGLPVGVSPIQMLTGLLHHAAPDGTPETPSTSRSSLTRISASLQRVK